MQKLNLIGEIYGRLTVLKEVEPIGPRKRKAYLCRCNCENKTEIIVKRDHLRRGCTKSCGCLNDEKRSARAENMYSKRIKYIPEKASAHRVFMRRYDDGDLTFDQFYELSQMNCFYCGINPSNLFNTAKEDSKSSKNKKENGVFKYSGLDRIDSSKPHMKDNVVPCCIMCNVAKRAYTVEEFRDWIIRLYGNFIINKNNK